MSYHPQHVIQSFHYGACPIQLMMINKENDKKDLMHKG